MNLFDRINEIIAPLKLSSKITSLQDIDLLLQILKVPVNSTIITELNFLDDCKNVLTAIENEIVLFNEEYQKYYDEFVKIKADIQVLCNPSLRNCLMSDKKC
jgi:hypothetical protein